MIFLSHNKNDKMIVEPVALQLRNIYGQENVFYDSWSIQPGEGIIDKMSEGLKKCKYFFYFVSSNSLNSNMVKMEWQNALFKAATGAIKFIAVRMDNSEMPTIITQNLYIDMYSYGFDVALRQIVDVIEGNNTFSPSFTKFQNLGAFVALEKPKLIIECRALHFMEPISRFYFYFVNDPKEIEFKVRGENCYTHSIRYNEKLPTINGFEIANEIYLEIDHATTPDFPFVAEFNPKNGDTLQLKAVYHQTNRKSIDLINISYI